MSTEFSRTETNDGSHCEPSTMIITEYYFSFGERDLKKIINEKSKYYNSRNHRQTLFLFKNVEYNISKIFSSFMV